MILLFPTPPTPREWLRMTPPTRAKWRTLALLQFTGSILGLTLVFFG